MSFDWTTPATEWGNNDDVHQESGCPDYDEGYEHGQAEETGESFAWASSDPAGDNNHFEESGGDGGFGESFAYHMQSLPDNAPELFANKLQNELKNIEFSNSKITEGSPWSSKAFVAQLDIPQPIKSALYDLKVDRLSKIQELVIPQLLQGASVVAQSQSGTGKTITFLTAAFKRVDPELAKPQVLIVLPTFELAHQVCLVAEEIGKNTPEITVKRAVRGERLIEDIQEHIIIGTPGKILDWMVSKRKLDVSCMKMVVFDEADELFDANQNRDMMLLVKASVPDDVQIVMFSATFSEEFVDFIAEFAPEAAILKLQQEEVALDNIKQLYVKVYNDHEKLSILRRILRIADAGNCFIFTQTKDDALEVYNALKEEEYPVGLISGNLEHYERKQAFEDFRSGKLRYLVATNVSARGIDVSNVCMVINYSLPYNPVVRGIDLEAYLHRIGRCGRFGKDGLALTFADRQNSEDQIRELVEHFQKPIDELVLEDELEMEAQLNN